MSKASKISKTSNTSPPEFLSAELKRGGNFFEAYTDILRHPAYQGLKPSTKNIYWCCRAQSIYGKAIACLEKTATRAGYYSEKEIDDMKGFKKGSQHEFFTFPAKHAEMYGYTRQAVSDSLGELYKAGFIRLVYNGASMHRANIWQFVGRWKYPKDQWQETWKQEIAIWEKGNAERVRKKK